MDKKVKSGSNLETVLRSGTFAVTTELNPPDSADPQDVCDAAEMLANFCDSMNVTDAPGANCHMSSVAVSALLTHANYEPVFQVTCRDRNRIAIQGDLIGAAALGVKNVLCITGDDVLVGDQPQAKRVFDFDSVQLIRTVRIMRDESIYLSGRKIVVAPRFFIGAVANPFVPPYDWRPHRMAKKIEAGADFIVTQYCFDIPRLRKFMKTACDLGLNEKAFILIGVGPLKSYKVAEYIRKNIPGVDIPDEIIDRLRKTPKNKQREESKKICVELIQQISETEGVAGTHIMAYRQEDLIGEIVEDAGLLPRPTKSIEL